MNKAIDILDELLPKANHTTDELEIILSEYANTVAAGSPDFIPNYYPKLKQLFSTYENDIQIAEGLMSLLEAITCYYKTEFNEAISPTTTAIELFSAIKHLNLLGMSHWAAGANNRSLGRIDEAVKHLYKGVELISDNGNFALYKCYCHYQLAEINVSIKDHEAARINYQEAAQMAEKINNTTAIFRSYNGLGNLFIVEQNYPEALVYLNKTLNIEGITKSERARTFCDLGNYYAKTNDLELSEKYYTQSVDIRKENNLLNAASTSLIGLGNTLLKQNQVEEAINHLNEALAICKQFNAIQKLMDCYHLLAQAHQRNEDWKLATEAYSHYDRIQQEENSKQLQNIYRLKNNKIAEQKNQIKIMLTEVHDSIEYAQGIQQAILPSNNLIRSKLPNCFILYQPKDVVSGDFYWLEPVGDMVIYAAADCTGHGVPGALVSVVCVNALNRSVREFGLTDPAAILEKTREIVIQTFEKSDHEIKDGMDIALCAIEGNTLKYAGAHNPLWIIRNQEIIEVKADKQPVGNHTHLSPFNTHTVHLQPGDMIYTFTDGFVDQFGGPKGKKFKARAFRELLISCQGQSLEDQKLTILKTFENWKGNLEQIDDICIIGVKH